MDQLQIGTPEQQSLNESNQYIGHIIHDGFYDKLIIIGFPYDIGARNCGEKAGHDYGPGNNQLFQCLDSFRRFVKDIGSIQNPEYELDISVGLPQISDYGNIQISPTNGVQASHKDLLDKLKQKVSLCLERQKIPFLIGGTREFFRACSQSIFDLNKQTLFILFRQQLDLQFSALDEIQLTQKNSLSTLLENPQFQNSEHKVIIIGLQNPSQKEINLIDRKNTKLITIEEAKHNKLFNGISITETGAMLENLIDQANQDSNIQQIYISISMESIQGVSGVSKPCLNGISSEEAVEICKISGYKSDKIVGIDICDYNPFIEDWSSGRLLATMFYYFTLGLSAKIQQKLIF